MAAVLLTEPKIRFFDNNGLPLAGGKLYTYVAGTVSTNKATFTDASGVTPNTNPVILDSAGYANVFISGSYKFVLTDSLNNTIWTEDNIISFSTGATGATFADNAFTLQNSADPTKQLMFSLASEVTGTTNIVTVPSGNFTIAKDSVFTGDSGSGGVKGLVPAPAAGDATKFLNGGGSFTQVTNIGTPITGTTQTTLDFTIPSGVSGVDVNLSQLSTNGTSPILMRLGDSIGIQSTGYNSYATRLGVIESFFTTSFGVIASVLGASSVYCGTLHLRRISGNKWTLSFTTCDTSGAGANNVFVGSGSLTLTNALQTVRLTTTSGTDQFDAGTVNVTLFE